MGYRVIFSTIGVLEDIKHPTIRENVKAHELVVGRNVEEQVLSLHLAARAILAAGVLTCKYVDEVFNIGLTKTLEASNAGQTFVMNDLSALLPHLARRQAVRD